MGQHTFHCHSMRIIYICSLYPKLTETFIAREIEKLVSFGYRVTICSLRPPAQDKSPSGVVVPGAQVIRSSLSPLALARMQVWWLAKDPFSWRTSWKEVYAGINHWHRLFHLAYILSTVFWIAHRFHLEVVDHIRAHFLHSEALAAMWLARLIKKPYSLTVHTSKIHYPLSLIRKMIQNASFITSISQDARDFALRLGAQKVHLVRNGLNLAEFQSKTYQTASPEIPLLVAVGSLVEKKGFDDLLQAISLLQQEGLDFQCRIYGEGPERHRLEGLVYDLGLEGVVTMPGTLPFEQLKVEMAQATIFVMPSKRTQVDIDGIPTVLIESMAMGVPVVATRIAGIPELVKDGETGLLAEPNNPDSLAKAIKRLLKDRNLQQILSQNGHKLVKSDYNIDITVPKIKRLLERYKS